MEPDALDARIVTYFTDNPRASVLEAARVLHVARGTVQARLDRLQREGVVSAWVPQVDPEGFGFPVVGFVSMAINQDLGHDAVAESLAAIPEVLELHTVSGESDLLARVVARSNADLQRVLDAIIATRSIVRSSTVIVLNTHFQGRTLPLFQISAGNASVGNPSAGNTWGTKPGQR